MQFFRFETLSMMFKLLNRVRLNMDLNELVVDAPVDSIAPNWCNVRQPGSLNMYSIQIPLCVGFFS